MSGLAAMLAPAPTAAAVGAGMLDRLTLVDGPPASTATLARAWLGVSGRPELCALAAPGATGDDSGHTPARPLAAAICGEIVNSRSLARDLGLDAPSPAELVLAAYRRWGAGLFDRLEGVYAVVLRDEALDLTLAGVDPRHIGALFAVALGGDVLFATEAQVFRSHPHFVPRLGHEALVSLMTQDNIVHGGSPFDGVLGLPLGFHFEVRGTSVSRVRHADDRDLCGGRLTGHAYVDRLAATIEELAGEAFAGERVALPLTGGLDSRLLAAALPAAARPLAFTFGNAGDDDVRVAGQIAASRGLDYRRYGLDSDYLRRGAAMTLQVSEGRLSPAVNLTGCQMEAFGGFESFVSGQGGEVGRRLFKTINLIPDRELLTAPPERFVDIAVRRHYRPIIDADTLRALFGDDGDDFNADGRRLEQRAFEASAGLHPVDRVDVYMGEMSFWFSRPAILFNRPWVGVRAPFHTRRWVAAVLAGAPSQRVDDLVRLQLIRRLDRRVARVPWALTHLPLPVSEAALLGLRVAGRVTPLGASLPAAVRGRTAAAGRRAKARLYSHGEDRDAWIRGGVHEYLAEVLLSRRCLERGIFREGGVRRLLAEELAGGQCSHGLGQLLNVELWHRRYVDGDDDGPTDTATS